MKSKKQKEEKKNMKILQYYEYTDIYVAEVRVFYFNHRFVIWAHTVFLQHLFSLSIQLDVSWKFAFHLHHNWLHTIKIESATAKFLLPVIVSSFIILSFLIDNLVQIRLPTLINIQSHSSILSNCFRFKYPTLSHNCCYCCFHNITFPICKT